MCQRKHQPFLRRVCRNEGTREALSVCVRVSACEAAERQEGKKKKKEESVCVSAPQSCAAILLAGFIPAVRDVTRRCSGAVGRRGRDAERRQI